MKLNECLIAIVSLLLISCRPLTLPGSSRNQADEGSEVISGKREGNKLSFTVNVAGPPRSGMRSVTGASDDDISKTGSPHGIRNIFQVIVIDEAAIHRTKHANDEGMDYTLDSIWDYDEEVQTSTDTTSLTLSVNILNGSTYHILMLGGHLEIDSISGTTIRYKDDEKNQNPTLLLAGAVTVDADFLGNIIPITIFPLVIDTYFLDRYGNRTDPSRSLAQQLGDLSAPWTAVWYIGNWLDTGDSINAGSVYGDGLIGLRQAYYALNPGGSTGAETESNIVVPMLPSSYREFYGKVSGGMVSDYQRLLSEDKIDGIDTSDLVELNLSSDVGLVKGDSGRVWMHLEYVPFGLADASQWLDEDGNWPREDWPGKGGSGSSKDYPVWVIRNGFNDEAQNIDTDFDTDFTSEATGKANGNGALNIEMIDSNYTGGLYEVIDNVEYNIISFNSTENVLEESLQKLNDPDGLANPTTGSPEPLDGREFIIKLQQNGPIGLHPQAIGLNDPDEDTDDGITYLEHIASTSTPVSISIQGIPTKANPVQTLYWAEALSPCPLISIQGSVELILQSNISLYGRMDTVTATGILPDGTSLLSHLLWNTALQGTQPDSPDNNVGALFSVGADASLSVQENCILSGNSNAIGSGGAVDVSGSFSLSDTAIIQYNAAQSGGGIALEAGGTFIMDGGSISGNLAAGDQASGGGVYNNGGIFTLKGGSISNNGAAQGSGLYLINGGVLNFLKGSIYGPVASTGLANGLSDSICSDSTNPGIARWGTSGQGEDTFGAFTGYRSANYINWTPVTVLANMPVLILPSVGAATSDTLTTAMSFGTEYYSGIYPGIITSGSLDSKQCLNGWRPLVSWSLQQGIEGSATGKWVFGPASSSATAGWGSITAPVTKDDILQAALDWCKAQKANYPGGLTIYLNGNIATGNSGIFNNVNIPSADYTYAAATIDGSLYPPLALTGTKAELATIQLSGDGSLFSIINAGNLTLGEGICLSGKGTQANGNALLTVSDADGSGGTVSFNGCLVLGNNNTSDSIAGGGISLLKNGTVFIENGSIEGNQAKNGGGIALSGDGALLSMPGGSIRYNNATISGDGLYMTAGSFEQGGGRIYGNSGNGIGTTGGNWTMTKGLVTGNTAYTDTKSGIVYEANISDSPADAQSGEAAFVKTGSGICIFGDGGGTISADTVVANNNSYVPHSLIAEKVNGSIIAPSLITVVIDISDLDLSGKVPKPVTNAVSVNYITTAVGYTGTITWTSKPFVTEYTMDEGERFSPRTAYTATVLLTASTYYAFVSGSEFIHSDSADGSPLPAGNVSIADDGATATILIHFAETATDAGSGPNME
jgi:hypothetical protein